MMRRWIERLRRPRAPAVPPSRAQTAWLLASAGLSTAFHLGHQPTWLIALAGFAFAWRAGQLVDRLPATPRWLLMLLVMAGVGAIGLHYDRLFGRDPGVALLVLLMALKLHELRALRDGYTVIFLGCFLQLAVFLYSQTPVVALLWLATVPVLVASLMALNHEPAPPLAQLRQALPLLAHSLPFMLALFVLFPRVPGPLWGLPLDAHGARAGLSDRMSPGSIAELSLSGAIAFRARFDGPVPAHHALYWRGPVFTRFDGRTWRAGADAGQMLADLPYAIPPQSAVVSYEVTLEAHNQPWLFALEMPSALPPGAAFTPYFQLLSRTPVRERLRYGARSALLGAVRPKSERDALNHALQLPVGGNARARALAAKWLGHDARPEAVLAAALSHFRQQPFHYTLSPPLLGRDSIDGFLFDTRRGFCEHYASAFVFLMRAAGIPARVVTGYQGGELNAVDGYLVVRQSDAHAWTEVWLADRGWQRVDPTAAILPSRVEHGLTRALGEAGTALPLLVRTDLDWLRGLRDRWEALNNGWNQWVLGYDQARQRELMHRLGLGEPDWVQLAAWLAASCALLSLPLLAWVWRQRAPADPLQRQWLRLEQTLRRAGLGRAPWEGPQDYAARIARLHPALDRVLIEAAQRYADARYGRADPRLAVQALRHSRKHIRSSLRHRTAP